MTVRTRRWLTLALAPLVAVSFLAAPTAPASADPDTSSSSSSGEGSSSGGGTSAIPDEGDDDVEANATLNDVLESSNRKYVQAKAAVTKSTATQKSLAVEINLAEAKRNALIPEVNAIAAQQYQTGHLGAASFLLGSQGSSDFLKKAVSLEEINTLHDRKLRELNAAIDLVNSKKAALDAEVKAQQTNLLAMQKQKASAEKALELVGGKSLTGGFVDAVSKQAAPAPRNAEGGFSPEKCTVNDPTTSGCITARTLHMYQEVKKAGFNRFVGCHRNGGPFEHPKGRACDWSLQKSGFSNAHNADMKNYGNNLMAFLVRNADRLGIYYVIWYQQIWFPATGNWHTYHGVSAHKDHVHVSML
ncbi:coiled-coil domain-containing protein [Actinoplanes sp. CA-030573]|uniref:coiled-coil domain-containing protein n=1 Tax=Actinoplanes sp. CA-030573 TaxID=3239898 RepID=UPI003D91921B